MTVEAWIVLGSVAILFCLLAFTRIAADIATMGVLTGFLLLGILKPDQAVAGFANKGMLTVGVLYAVVAGLKYTGTTRWIGQHLLGHPNSYGTAMLRLMIPVIGISAFLNNTPVVAMMIPAVTDWARKMKISPSKLMIPLSYASIFGGTCTLIGTSTNLVVSGLMQAQTELPDVGLFDIAWLGAPCAVAGVGYLMLTANRLLPDRMDPLATSGRTDELKQYTVEMIVLPDGPMVGKSITDAELRHLRGLYLAEIIRQENRIPAVEPTEILQANDHLIFAGDPQSIIDLRQLPGLDAPGSSQLTRHQLHCCMVEVVVAESCPLIGQSIRDGRFRTVYDAAVVAAARQGERLYGKMGDIVIRPGDALLLDAKPHFTREHSQSRDFILVSDVPGSQRLRTERMPWAITILIGMILAASLGGIPMLIAALTAAGAMLLTRCCTSAEARNDIDWSVLLVIAGAFGIGKALQQTGAAAVVMQTLLQYTGNSPYMTLIVIYVLTSLATELITNNAAAVLMFPFALAAARQMDVNFMPFAMCLMVAASACFATPLGYQTNLMVQGPGGYRFADFLKIGLPMNIIQATVALAIAPLVWHF